MSYLNIIIIRCLALQREDVNAGFLGKKVACFSPFLSEVNMIVISSFYIPFSDLSNGGAFQVPFPFIVREVSASDYLKSVRPGKKAGDSTVSNVRCYQYERGSSGSSGSAVGSHPRRPGFDSQSGPSQIFIALLCPSSTKWVVRSLKTRRNTFSFILREVSASDYLKSVRPGKKAGDPTVSNARCYQNERGSGGSSGRAVGSHPGHKLNWEDEGMELPVRLMSYRKKNQPSSARDHAEAHCMEVCLSSVHKIPYAGFTLIVTNFPFQ
ncbi:hypothetical protein PoB_004318800 [Plakobranchus ocellatus]|uniref:Uncharacterized protein n=1 Tax=Plakobranchus ocellatus TaxID=259542 RepID=A0AAV4BC06_9GAST|nr:hypothetical protein PoB_004318800 [Plakobranchus ocellatus]